MGYLLPYTDMRPLLIGPPLWGPRNDVIYVCSPLGVSFFELSQFALIIFQFEEEVEFDDFTERSALTDRDVSDLNVPASGVQASCGWDAEKYKRKLRKLHLNEKKCIKTKLRKLQILH